ncbi:MAG: hypothetical protein KDC98_12830, partial [Planctomycetes bacterium]|nr:hypothetical protein [Planctomycetota bacterium]
MDLSLEQRLLRFLLREERDEARASRELRAQPVDLRVIDGECIRDARFLGEARGAFRFAVADNTSKFRPGDAVVVGDGVELEDGAALAYGDYDSDRGELVLERDPYRRDLAIEFEVGRDYVVDRRPLGLTG